MSNDLDLDERLARVGGHLDGLARDAGADEYEPGRLPQRTGASGPHVFFRVAAVVLVLAGLVAGAAALRPDPDPASPTGLPGPPVTSAASERLSAHPVLAQAIADSCAPGWVSSSFGVCFRLGPPGFTGADVASARAVDQDGAWAVGITLADGSRAAEMFDACATGAASCPDLDGSSGHGAVAFVVDGEVRSAPSIQIPGLASGELFLTPGSRGASDPGFTEAEAQALAESLD